MSLVEKKIDSDRLDQSARDNVKATLAAIEALECLKRLLMDLQDHS